MLLLCPVYWWGNWVSERLNNSKLWLTFLKGNAVLWGVYTWIRVFSDSLTTLFMEMPSWKTLQILTNKTRNQHFGPDSSGNIVYCAHATNTNWFYDEQPIFQMLSNVLPHFKFNPFSKVRREGGLATLILRLWKLRCRNIPVCKW